jgi:hypothetical protein
MRLALVDPVHHEHDQLGLHWPCCFTRVSHNILGAGRSSGRLCYLEDWLPDARLHAGWLHGPSCDAAGHSAGCSGAAKLIQRCKQTAGMLCQTGKQFATHLLLFPCSIKAEAAGHIPASSIHTHRAQMSDQRASRSLPSLAGVAPAM